MKLAFNDGVTHCLRLLFFISFAARVRYNLYVSEIGSISIFKCTRHEINLHC
jgi:hypothetical protein